MFSFAVVMTAQNQSVNSDTKRCQRHGFRPIVLSITRLCVTDNTTFRVACGTDNALFAGDFATFREQLVLPITQLCVTDNTAFRTDCVIDNTDDVQVLIAGICDLHYLVQRP